LGEDKVKELESNDRDCDELRRLLEEYPTGRGEGTKSEGVKLLMGR
jgi:hypothetical protein